MLNANNLSREERAKLCTALNRQFPFGLRASNETLQLFTERQMELAAPAELLDKLRRGAVQ